MSFIEKGKVHMQINKEKKVIVLLNKRKKKQVITYFFTFSLILYFTTKFQLQIYILIATF